MTIVSLERARRAEQALYEYALAVDTSDMAALRTMITDDVVIDQNDKIDTGADDFIAVYAGFAESGANFSRHLVSNVRVREESADRLHVDAYFEATVGSPESNQRLYGRYSDTLVERDGALLIEKKRIVIERIIDLAGAVVEYQPY